MASLPPTQVNGSDLTTWWHQRAQWLYVALTDEQLPDVKGLDDSPEVVALAIEPLGTMTFPDGLLVVADPYVMGPDVRPVGQQLSVEPYRVLVARAQVGPDHQRIAAALLVGAQAPIVAWDMARSPDDDLAKLEPEHYFGYGVDAGTGCFAAVGAGRVLGRVLSDDGGMLEDPVSVALLAESPSAAAVLLAPEPDATEVAVFSSGWGDGYYPTWLGLDEAGRVVVAVTDFLLTGDPFATPATVAEGTPAAAPTEVAPAKQARKSRLRSLFGR